MNTDEFIEIAVMANNLTECEVLFKFASEVVKNGDVEFAPQCKLDGSFSKLQCWEGECWCVDHNGVMINGTKSKTRQNCPDGMPLQ